MSWVGYASVCMVAARPSVYMMLVARAAVWHSRTAKCKLSPDLPAYAVPVYMCVASGGYKGVLLPAATSNG